MPSYYPPKRATEFIFNIGLRSQSTNEILDSPTIASGDFKISKDNGSTANLNTLPSVSPSSSGIVKVTVSSTEMTADNVTIVAKDASGSEWWSQVVNIQTAARQIDDLAFPTTSGRSMDVTATGAVGIDWNNIENQTSSVGLTNTTISASQAVASVTGAVGSVGAGGITASTIATGAIDADALATDAVTEIANGFLDLADAVETGLTVRGHFRLQGAAHAGVLSGAGTNTMVMRNAVANSKARITATVDQTGNRTAVGTDTT